MAVEPPIVAFIGGERRSAPVVSGEGRVEAVPMDGKSQSVEIAETAKHEADCPQAHAFYVAKSGVWDEILKPFEIIPKIIGLRPLTEPSATGRLEYKIVVEGIPAVALMDHGASYTFICKEWCRKNGLVTVEFSEPMLLTEFSGHVVSTSSSLRSARVSFAQVTGRWSFVVIEGIPALVVIGLNMIRA